MATKSVGKLFRDVVIDPHLKEQVNTILLASSPEERAVLSATRRIRAMTTPATAYLFASEIRGYLEEKTRVGTEPWVYPVAGDLFLDALEANISTVGPNLFRDHYSGMAGCYREARCPVKAVQGALYCIDLVLQKTIDLFLTKDTQRRAEDGVPLSFLTTEESDYQRSIALFLNLGQQCLRDAIETMLHMGGADTPPVFLNLVIEYRESFQTLLNRWDAYHKTPNLSSRYNEEYLEGLAGVAEQVSYPPLSAMIEQYLVRLRDAKGLEANGKTELEEEIHPLYNAASMYLTQGTKERDAEAYDLAYRRYNRAAGIFTEIRDRTSTAKVLVEQARAAIKHGRDPDGVRDWLYKAVCLVIAHMKNMPHGTLPAPTDDKVIQFLAKKGYAIEAEAYAAALDNVPFVNHR